MNEESVDFYFRLIKQNLNVDESQYRSILKLACQLDKISMDNATDFAYDAINKYSVDFAEFLFEKLNIIGSREDIEIIFNHFIATKHQKQ